MAMTSEEFAKFNALVEETGRRTERQCQGYLHHAAGLLIPTAISDVKTILEERNYFGSTDFIISANIRDEVQREYRAAYIWELKAPQCYLFEKDTNNRCRATEDFLQAENQLLHYVHQAVADGDFRRRMKVVDHTNIRMGGIIIGTRKRFVKDSAGDDDVDKAETALKVREVYFYDRSGLRVMTWDAILDFTRPSDP